MGLFDSIQNLIGGATGSIGDAVGGLPEIPGLQEVQDLVVGATEAVSPVVGGVTEAVATVAEQGQTAVEDITQNIGL